MKIVIYIEPVKSVLPYPNESRGEDFLRNPYDYMHWKKP
jgi:hypothetical protein